jgi:LysM repeat protein
MRRALVLFGGLLGPAVAFAQDEGAPAPTTVIEVQPGQTTTTQSTSIYGPAPPSIDAVNEHLPSSSKATTDTSRSSDGFDLSRSGQPATVVRGSEGGAYILEGQYVPDMHTAKRGDTLWGISQRYYGNPYNWPRIWASNKQIQNPHWIYPGDQIRLKGGHGVRTGGFVRPAPTVPPNTVYSRFYGYLLDGDAEPENWGEIVGSPEDQMLLSENDEIYIKIHDDKMDEVKIENGQLLTIFEPREVKNLSEHPVVWIRGIAKVNRVNEKTGMIRARIVESMTVIERGALAGPMHRKMDVVQPTRNEKTIEARIVGALYPYEFYGQGHYVFLDKGKEDGVKVGNRFFAVSRGDEWRLGLRTAGKMADDRAITEDDRMARVEDTPDNDMPDLYPAETYAELIVMRVREKTATAFVTASIREISRGSVVVARQGY